MAGGTAVMVLAVWVAALVEKPFRYLGDWGFVWTVGVLVAAAILAMIFRLVRGASLADIHPGWILGAWFLVRFAVIPATFLLALFWLIASAVGLGFAGTLGEAAMMTLLYGTGAILLTSAVADAAAGIRGPRRAPSSDD